MSFTVDISEESAALLARQAAERGLSVDSWIEELARERAASRNIDAAQTVTDLSIARILEIQRRVKPDPAGWTVRDYIDAGRK